MEHRCGFEPHSRRFAGVRLAIWLAVRILERLAGLEPASVRWQRTILPSERQPHGAPGRSRTHNQPVKNRQLCQLSYERMVLPAGLEPALFCVRSAVPSPLGDGSKLVRAAGLEPACSAWKADSLAAS